MRERERGEFFRARQRVSFRAHTHTHTQRPKTRRKKNLPGQKKKSLLSSSCVDPDLCPNGKGRADLSKSFFLSRARRGANGVDRSIDRGARARRSGTSDRWDRGRLPSLRETTHRIVRGKWGGGEIVQTQHPNERESTSKAFGKVLFSATNSREKARRRRRRRRRTLILYAKYRFSTILLWTFGLFKSRSICVRVRLLLATCSSSSSSSEAKMRAVRSRSSIREPPPPPSSPPPDVFFRPRRRKPGMIDSSSSSSS